MNYIFSNVHRFENDKDFVKALENVDFRDGDTLIFLNKAVPFDHASNFFQRFNIISLHRIHIAPTGEIKWFGKEEMLRRMDECRHNKTDSQVPSSDNRCISMFYLDNAGVVKDRNGNVFWNIGIENYPSGKMPTTGFYAYNFALQCLKGGVTLVNFYGSQDSSTNKWNGHDWDYEELVLQNVPHRISISPPNWKPSDVNIIRDASSSVKKVPWRDMGESDITSLWQQTWGEKSALSNIETPKVSVVMPVYNAESYLSEALASVLLQKAIPEVEVICIDDGSSDNSATILGFWKNNDPRLKVIRQENQGPGVARNVGLDVTRGEYVYFLDADDRISSGDILLRAYSQAKADKLDVLLADGSVMSENGIVTKRDAYLNRNVVPKEQVFSPDTLGVNLYIIATMGPAAKLFRREFLNNENLRFPALKRSEDFPMIQLAISLTRCIGVMPLSIFERRTDVITSRESTKDESPLIFAEAEQIFRSYLSEWELQDKYERAADVALIVRLAYNLRSVHQFASFRSIVHYCAEMFPRLKIKQDEVVGVSFATAFEFLIDVIAASNDTNRLADVFAEKVKVAKLQSKLTDAQAFVDCRNVQIEELKAVVSRRDAEIAKRDKWLADAREGAKRRDAEIAKRDKWLADAREGAERRDAEIAKRDKWLADAREGAKRRDAEIAKRDKWLADARKGAERRDAEIAKRDKCFAEEREDTERCMRELRALKRRIVVSEDILQSLRKVSYEG